MPNIEIVVEERPTYIDVIPPDQTPVDVVYDLKVWGSITGTMSAQEDLQDALDLKLEAADLTFSSLTGEASDNASLVSYVSSRVSTPIAFHWTTTNPVDGATYYIGTAGLALGSTSANTHGVAPITGTIYMASINTRNNVVNTNEPSTFAVSINGGADQVITNNYVFVNAPPSQLLVTGLAISVTQGDTIYLKFTAATWVTNPTNTAGSVILYIR